MEKVTWLSGAIVTFINKILGVLWIAAVVGAISGIYLGTGRVFIATNFRFVVGFILLATVFIFWLSVRIHRVGYVNGELIVSNYLREEHIPFDHVEAAEPVWWYYRRMVRVRFRVHTSFGQVVYYIPKWAAFKGLWVAPEKELQEVLEANRDLRSIYPEGYR